MWEADSIETRVKEQGDLAVCDCLGQTEDSDNAAWEQQALAVVSHCSWHSAKRAGVERVCSIKVIAHMWFMHDAHLGRAFLFLGAHIAVNDSYGLWYVVGMKLVMSYVKFPQAPLARAPFGECRCRMHT